MSTLTNLDAPAWVPVFLALGPSLIPFLVCVTLTFVFGLWASRPTLALTPESHWTERARLWFPTVSFLSTSVILAGLVGLGVGVMSHGPLSHLPRLVHAFICVVSGFLGAQVGGYFLLRVRRASSIASGRISSLLDYLNVVWTTQWFMPHLLLVFSLFLPLSGSMTMVDWASWAGVLALFVLVQVTSPYTRMAAVGRGRLAQPRLAALVAAAFERHSVEPVKVWEVDLNYANAYAFTFTQELVVTSNVLDLLNDDELSSVLDHEIAHLTEPRSIHLLRIGRAIVLPLGLSCGVALALQGHYEALVFMLVVIFALQWFFQRVSRRMEERADAHGTEHEQTLGAYAHALEKIYEHNLAPATTRSRSRSHPNLYDRMCDAGVEPDYPRPEPPPRSRGPLAGYILTLASAITALLLFMSAPSTEREAWFRVACTGGDVSALLDLTNVHVAARTLEKMRPVLEFVERTNPTLSPYDAMTLGWQYVNLGDCAVAHGVYRSRVLPALEREGRLSAFESKMSEDLRGLHDASPVPSDLVR